MYAFKMGAKMKKYFIEIFAVTSRILIELLRMRRSLIFWVVFPTLMLLLFGCIYASGNGVANSFDFTPPGILIGAALFFSCLGSPVALLVGERERRTLRRILVSPLRPVSYFIGIVVAYLIIAFGQTVIVMGLPFSLAEIPWLIAAGSADHLLSVFPMWAPDFISALDLQKEQKTSADRL